MVIRRAWPGVLILAGLVGCRASGFNQGLTAPEPLPAQAPSQAAEFIERTNANAARVASLESPASIHMERNLQERRMAFSVSGEMALERPRSFRMLLSSVARTEADIGSNDSEFWFWTSRDNRDRAIYVCEYGEGGEATLPGAMQPDWIIEAMGLRSIPADEAVAATVKTLPSGETLLTTRRRGSQPGERLIKETVFDTATGRVKEHRLLSELQGAAPSLLASARIKTSQALRTPSATDPNEDEVATIPTAITLAWYQPREAKPHYQMDVTLSKPILNPKFDAERRTELFTEPVIRGFARRSLRDNTAMAAEVPSTRKSRSIPPSPSAGRPGFVNDDNGVELGEPEAEDGDLPPVRTSAPATKPATTPRSPSRLTPADDLPPISAIRPHSAEAVISARVPTAPINY